MRPAPVVALVTLLACCTGLAAQRRPPSEAFDLDHPAIRYQTAPTTDPVAALNQRLQAGGQLPFDETTGYLRPLLTVLGVPVESQTLVYSKTSFQKDRITPQNPRAVFFNDSVAVAWVPGGFIEVAAHDPRQGAIFYVLPQTRMAAPQLVRNSTCITCHYSTAAEGVPGFLLRSIATATDGRTMPWLGNFTTDHRSPLQERWGGWYVTGTTADTPHLGNRIVSSRDAAEIPPSDGALTWATLEQIFASGRYLSRHSDVAALLVLDHQVRLMNLLTRAGWEARVLPPDTDAGAASIALREVVVPLVDYVLFIDEAPLPTVHGTSAFAETFAAQGPKDRKGRSLRDLDLRHRLMRYPCSYMIYSASFDALPAPARDAVYRRLWEVLSGKDRSEKYSRLSKADRLAIIEILGDTKRDLPVYFRH